MKEMGRRSLRKQMLLESWRRVSHPKRSRIVREKEERMATVDKKKQVKRNCQSSLTVHRLSLILNFSQ